jgi:SAM-dependent methyltransferase
MNKNRYLSGEVLFGDDFSKEEIIKWYDEEKEGYASLPSTELDLLKKGVYLYENLNRLHAFEHLPENIFFNQALGIGSATGEEFLPIIDRIENITILEPSDNLIQASKINKQIQYVKPNKLGEMPFENNSFDLVTCFGVLHHIANVSFVFSEIHRVLRPGGIFIFREPIISMGDWRNHRVNLTKNERGLPVSFIDQKIQENNFEVLNESYCITGTSFLSKFLRPFLNYPLVYYRLYLKLDKAISGLLKNKVKYHTENKFRRVYPSAKYFIIKKVE